MEKGKEEKAVLKVFGILLIVVSIVYLIVGVVATVGEVEGLLPADKNAETLVVVLAHGTAIIAFICGIVSLNTAKKGTGTGLCKALGIVMAVLGLASLIYVQLMQDAFNVFDMVAVVIGVGIFSAAGKIEKAQK